MCTEHQLDPVPSGVAWAGGEGRGNPTEEGAESLGGGLGDPGVGGGRAWRAPGGGLGYPQEVGLETPGEHARRSEDTLQTKAWRLVGFRGRQGRRRGQARAGAPRMRTGPRSAPLGARPPIAQAWPPDRRLTAERVAPRPQLRWSRATSRGARPGLAADPAFDPAPRRPGQWHLRGGALPRRPRAAGQRSAGARAGTGQRRERADSGVGGAWSRGRGLAWRGGGAVWRGCGRGPVRKGWT